MIPKAISTAGPQYQTTATTTPMCVTMNLQPHVPCGKARPNRKVLCQKHTRGYKSETQEKNIAWFLPRPKPDRYKGGMPLYAEEWLIQLAKDILKRNDIDVLNLFCGMNTIGIRIDLNPDVKPDHIADAHFFADNWDDSLFDVILADPPYSDEEAKQLYGTGKLNYSKWTAQCDKVLRRGGLLIVYHKYVMPNPDPENYEVVKRVFIGNRIRHLPRIAIYFRKKQLKKANK